MIICPNCGKHDLIKVNILGYDQCTHCGYVFPGRRHSLKADIINSVRQSNCPVYPNCIGCRHVCYVSEEFGVTQFICGNDEYDKKTYRVKPRRTKSCGKRTVTKV